MRVSSLQNNPNLPSKSNKIDKVEQEKELPVETNFVKADVNNIRAKYVAFLGTPSVQDKLTIVTDIDEDYVPPTEEEIIAADTHTKPDDSPEEKIYEASSPGRDLTWKYFNEIDAFSLFENKEQEIKAFEKRDAAADLLIKASDKYENLFMECCKNYGVDPEAILNAEKKEASNTEPEEGNQDPEELEEDEKGKSPYEEVRSKLAKLDKIYHKLDENTKVAFNAELEKSKIGLKAAETEYVKRRNDIVEANLRLVPHVVKKYKNQGINYLDLIGDGNEGLIRAAERYDLNCGLKEGGAKFSTYAISAIERTIERGIYDKVRTIRVTKWAQRTSFKVYKAERDFINEFGRNPSPKEVAEITGLPLKHIKLVKTLPKAISFETPTSSKSAKGDNGGTIGKFVENTDFSDSSFVFNTAYVESPYEALLYAEKKKMLDDAYDEVLNAREKFIMQHRYPPNKEEMEQGVIGIELESAGLSKKSLSKERVRQLEEKAKEKVERVIHRKQQESIRRQQFSNYL